MHPVFISDAPNAMSVWKQIAIALWEIDEDIDIDEHEVNDGREETEDIQKREYLDNLLITQYNILVLMYFYMK
ncbi:hypothetical protein RCL_jg20944.t1 [Rhizophagus clarus]|uniref:Uncharacterized protein n=1 Tax=Rhizophagus clarus TaxID=94130 RepID=A0A8H3LH92_9GLOM|nr:hypothetical protein RCL_jg20944.t1 [Rhizophagus clarus]